MSAHALIVDDSASMRGVLRITLGDAGYRVSEAGDGQAALSLARSQQFDVVITDINMPGMDGFSLIKSLRGMRGYEHTPILTLTTETSDNKKNMGRAAGATGWINKPFSPDKLLAALKKLLN